MRRALGLLAMILTLHLSLVSGDFACAKHGSTLAAAAHDMSGMAHQSHPSQSHGEEGQQCDTPAAPDCCGALASCAPSMAPAGAMIASAAASPRVSRPAGDLDALLSHLVAPDPPPPKA